MNADGFCVCSSTKNAGSDQARLRRDAVLLERLIRGQSAGFDKLAEDAGRLDTGTTVTGLDKGRA